MKEISVDVGYGFVKAAAEDGYKGTQLITFPSAVLADHSSGDLGQFFGNKHMGAG